MNLEEIMPDITMESGQTEFKERLNHNDTVSWLKTVAGFANAQGGDLYIGVKDDHTLAGFSRKEADQERNYFNNQINEHLTPRPEMHISFPAFHVRNTEKFIIHVQIPSSSIKPVILNYKGVPSIFMRRDGFTNGATYEEIIEMGIHSQNTQYDSLYTDIPYQRSDFQKLIAFCSEHADGKKLTDKALASVGFYNDEKMLSNGAVLFQDNYKGGKTAVMCSVFSGFTKGSERVVTVNKFSGPLTDTIRYMMEFTEQRMNHSFVKLADRRVNTDAYPSRALFEGIINAVAHRDYYLDGTQIQIDMYRDRLEISSPGSFYRGAPIQKTYDLSSLISKRRNEVICNVLVACRVMEASGTGFDKIVEDYSDADQNHKPYVYSSSDHFTLILPDLTYQAGIEDDSAYPVSFMPVSDGTKHDEKVLSFCYGKAHKSAEIANYLGISDSSYLRSKVLKNLVNNGYLKTGKQGKTIYYRTNRELVSLK